MAGRNRRRRAPLFPLPRLLAPQAYNAALLELVQATNRSARIPICSSRASSRWRNDTRCRSALCRTSSRACSSKPTIAGSTRATSIHPDAGDPLRPRPAGRLQRVRGSLDLLPRRVQPGRRAARLRSFMRKEEFDVPIFQRLFLLFKLKRLRRARRRKS